MENETPFNTENRPEPKFKSILDIATNTINPNDPQYTENESNDDTFGSKKITPNK